MADCLFCSIISGSTPAVVIASEPSVVVVLDHRPVFKGHALVLPRAHFPTLTELPPTQVTAFFGAVQRVVGAVEVGLGAGGTFVAMNNRVSQSVPHLHCHVVPRHRGDGLRGFFWPRSRYASDEEADGYAAAIRSALPAS